MDQVLVIQVARHVRREGSKHLINLPGKSQGEKVAWEGFGTRAGRRDGICWDGGKLAEGGNEIIPLPGKTSPPVSSAFL